MINFIKLMLIGTAMIVGVSSVALSDTLVLKTQNESSSVSVKCNGKKGPESVPPNGSINPIRWFMVYLWFGSRTLSCDFTEDSTGTVIGHADLSISPNVAQAMITSESSTYKVDIEPANATSQPVNDISVTLTK